MPGLPIIDLNPEAIGEVYKRSVGDAPAQYRIPTVEEMMSWPHGDLLAGMSPEDKAALTRYVTTTVLPSSPAGDILEGASVLPNGTGWIKAEAPLQSGEDSWARRDLLRKQYAPLREKAPVASAAEPLSGPEEYLSARSQMISDKLTEQRNLQLKQIQEQLAPALRDQTERYDLERQQAEKLDPESKAKKLQDIKNREERDELALKQKVRPMLEQVEAEYKQTLIKARADHATQILAVQSARKGALKAGASSEEAERIAYSEAGLSQPPVQREPTPAQLLDDLNKREQQLMSYRNGKFWVKPGKQGGVFSSGKPAEIMVKKPADEWVSEKGDDPADHRKATPEEEAEFWSVQGALEDTRAARIPALTAYTGRKVNQLIGRGVVDKMAMGLPPGKRGIVIAEPNTPSRGSPPPGYQGKKAPTPQLIRELRDSGLSKEETAQWLTENGYDVNAG